MFVKKIFKKVAGNVGFADFPNISSIPSYGVFGRFGPNQGYIFFDDEDNDVNIWGNDEPEEQQNHNFLLGGDQNIDNCIEGGINSRLYFSSAKTDCYHNPIY